MHASFPPATASKTDSVPAQPIAVHSFDDADLADGQNPPNVALGRPFWQAARAALHKQAAVEFEIPEPACVVCAWPIPAAKGTTVLAAAIAKDEQLPALRGRLQLQVAELTAAAAECDREVEDAGWMARLICDCLACDDLQSSCRLLAQAVEKKFGVRQVAVASILDDRNIEFHAFSNQSWDPRSPAVQATRALVRTALQETVRHSVEPSSASQVVLLKDSASRTRVAFAIDGNQTEVAAAAAAVQQSSAALIALIETRRRAERSVLAGLAAALQSKIRQRSGRLTLLAVLLAALALACPVPHRIHCNCVIEPASRRFVTAPFNATLLHTHVKPGDMVEAGQLLAELDGRQLRLERNSLAADREQAAKRRDTAQATRHYSEAEISKLDIERLDNELAVIDQRLGELEIRSPTAGMILAGDLERSTGVPLESGQTLFEVALLDDLILEVAIPDRDIASARAGDTVTVDLDAGIAIPEQQLGPIHPRAMLRDDANVFIADTRMTLNREMDQGSDLRPGMQGTATISAGYHTLAQKLFRSPWNRVRKWLTW